LVGIPLEDPDFDALIVLVLVDDEVPVDDLLGVKDTDGDPVEVFDTVILEVDVLVKCDDFV
jgi:hypothetical protein